GNAPAADMVLKAPGDAKMTKTAVP
nr:RecName: Full=Cytochrome c3-2 [Nitratidesulfovibrio vulgaris]AAA02684.1 cytochrome c3 {N-terminal} [Desulfovibrio vulgaris, DSM 1744, Peptide Partial, 24 aa] [Nitratidesulfovibrio vulgaris]